MKMVYKTKDLSDNYIRLKIDEDEEVNIAIILYEPKYIECNINEREFEISFFNKTNDLIYNLTASFKAIRENKNYKSLEYVKEYYENRIEKDGRRAFARARALIEQYAGIQYVWVDKDFKEIDEELIATHQR